MKLITKIKKGKTIIIIYFILIIILLIFFFSLVFNFNIFSLVFKFFHYAISLFQFINTFYFIFFLLIIVMHLILKFITFLELSFLFLFIIEFEALGFVRSSFSIDDAFHLTCLKVRFISRQLFLVTLNGWP